MSVRADGLGIKHQTSLTTTRFGAVAPLLISCSVSSMAAERERQGKSPTHRGWPLNSRAEEKTTVFCTFDWAEVVCDLEAKE